jgi:retron-type reverse transcriptase
VHACVVVGHGVGDARDDRVGPRRSNAPGLPDDIAGCFGSLDHDVMASTLAEKIHDNRFLRLVRGMLTAGYLED